MCGIAGIFSFNGHPVTLAEVKSMCAAIYNRGPDDEGYYIDSNIGLGMRRLSIIDLDSGHQPVANEDGSVQVVLNGEIYNYREIRKELQEKGHRFSTASDTEVIAHLYEEYGDACVKHLRGMFAFALWDKNRQKLLVARDRLGIKPLYFGTVNERLIFASELKAILQLSDIKRDLNWNSLGHVFAFLTSPRNESVIRGIHKLEPGHILTAGIGRELKIRCYWDVAFKPDYGKSQQYFIENLRELLKESVCLRMISDVPLGAFLSGGIDSSAVVATMAQLSSTRIKTFSIGFSEKEFNEACYAREVAGYLNTDHHELILEPDIVNILDDLAWHLDEPFGDSSAIPTYMVSKLAAEHVTVALSGDGGDELFAGYSKYLVEQKEQRYRHIPAAIRQMMGAVGGQMRNGMKGRNFLRHIALNGGARYMDANSMFRRDELQGLFSAEVAEKVMAEDLWQERIEFLDSLDGDWLSNVQYMDMKNYLPLDILTKVDRMSMANSLEARVPLLDHKLVEFAATIPPQYRIHKGVTKYIFKEAMRGILPDSIIDRKKQGFAVPLGSWFRGELDNYVRDLLLSDTSRKRGIFNPAYIENLLILQKQGRPLDLQLWTLLSFELWCRKFLDQPVSANVLNFSRRGDEKIEEPGERAMSKLETDKSATEKIRLLKVVNTFETGGTEGQVMSFVKKLDLDIFDLKVACLEKTGSLMKEYEKRGIPISEFKIKKLYSPKTFSQIYKLASFMRDNRIQVLHCYNFYAMIIAIPAAKIAGVPVVITSIRDRGIYLSKAKKIMQKWTCKMADNILVNADSIEQWLLEEGYNADKIEVIKNGIDLSLYENSTENSIRKEFNIPSKSNIVVMIARLNYMKGVEDFIRAANTVNQYHPDTYFLIIGSPSIECLHVNENGCSEYDDWNRLIARFNMKKKIIFTGNRSDIPAFLAEASISVLPSHSEGLSNTLLESMAAGVPIVTTNTGGNPELVADGVNGILVPVKSPRAIAKAINKILGDNILAEKFSRESLYRAKNDHSLAQMVSKTTALYNNRLLSHSKAGSINCTANI